MRRAPLMSMVIGILNMYQMMKRENKKVEKPIANTSKSREECQYCKKMNHQEKKCFWNPNNPKKNKE
jgi:hypothetical protein